MMMVLRTASLIALAALPLSAQTSSITWHPFKFVSSAGDTVDADSGRVVVLENRAKPNGARIQIAVARLRSTAARPGTPIVYLAGGPGGAGIAGVRGEIFATVQALRSVSDVILYDQRGTGLTLPSLAVRTRFGVPLTMSSAAPEAMQALLANSRAAAAEVRARGVDLASYNTLESAADLDDIRKTLGVPKLIVWGHSYGSHLGLAYLRRYPTRTERAILGGINGVDHRRRYPMDGDELFARLDSIVRATPKLNAVMPDFLGSTRRVLASLAADPVTVRVDSQDVLVSREDVQAVLSIQSGEQAFVRRLPWLVGRMEAGDYSAMGRMVRDGLKARPLGTTMTYVMDMASGVSPARARRIREQAPTALLGNAVNFPFDDPDFRAAWGPADLGDAFRAPIRSSVPALFISGTLDGRTSLGDAEEVRRGFRTNAHYVLAGASHNPYAADAALLDAMVRFARGARLRDTTIVLRNVELRGPDESQLIGEIVQAAAAGPDAAVQRLDELARDGSRYVSSFVVSGAAQSLMQSNAPAAAALIVRGAALFPSNPMLLTRLGEVLVARGDVTGARRAFQRAVALDPFARSAAAQLARLP